MFDFAKTSHTTKCASYFSIVSILSPLFSCRKKLFYRVLQIKVSSKEGLKKSMDYIFSHFKINEPVKYSTYVLSHSIFHKVWYLKRKKKKKEGIG